MQDNIFIEETKRWLEKVVIGLNLCPFASKPYLQNQIRFFVSYANNEIDILKELEQELTFLAKTNKKQTETTLFILANYLKEFYQYNQFLNPAEALLEQLNLVGDIQIATFHPNYQFAGTEPSDAENLTNRSPYPILHLIREESLEQALLKYHHPEKIPENNIKKVKSLTKHHKSKLFPYLEEDKK